MYILIAATVPNLLLSEDVTGQEVEDSDLEIDPGTLTPPTAGSPLRMDDSPTIQEMLSAMGGYFSGKTTFYTFCKQLF